MKTSPCLYDLRRPIRMRCLLSTCLGLFVCLGVAWGATITGTVWQDSSRDGVQDSGELGIANVTVRLVSSAGVTLSTVQTGAIGSYIFPGVVPGTYEVVFDPSTSAIANLSATPPHIGSDDAVDSDIDINTLSSGLLVIDDDAVMIDLDAGFSESVPTICYAIADEQAPGDAGGGTYNDVLYVFDSNAGTWTLVGTSSVVNAEAAAFDPVLNVLYTTDGDNFGIIDTTTAAFTPIGPAIGAITGAVGSVDVSEISGLSYDPFTGLIWVTDRREAAVTERDILFVIDPATGLPVPNFFGAGQDYVPIATVFDTCTSTNVFDVDDIAIDPRTGELYGIANQGGSGGMLVTINKVNGSIDSVVGSFCPFDDMEGLAFFNNGSFFGTTGGNGPDPADNNGFYSIDPSTATATFLGTIDPRGIDIDFEGVDCLTGGTNMILGTVLLKNSCDADPADAPDAPGVPNVTVELYLDANTNGVIDAGDPLVDTNVTDASGDYTFVTAASGTFLTRMDPGSIPTGVDVSGDNVESQAFSDLNQTDAENDFCLCLNFDLALIKTSATPNPVVPGGDVTFTITVVNQGDAVAEAVTDIVVVDYQPDGWTNNDPDWNFGIFTIPFLAAGDSTNITVTLTAPIPVAPGFATNYAEIITFEDTNGVLQADVDSELVLEPFGDDNEVDDALTDPSDHDDLDPDVIEIVHFDLALTKTLPRPNPTAPGGEMTFTITVFNQGSNPVQAAQNIVLQEYPPTGFAITDPNWNFLNQLTIPFLAAGDSTNVTVTLTAPIPLPAGRYTNYSEIISFTDTNGNAAVDIDSQADLGPGNDASEVNDDVSDSADHDDLDFEPFATVLFDLALTKTNPTPSPIAPGDDVTFTITVFNQGTSVVQNAENIIITETPPAGWAINDPDWSLAGTFTIPSLAAGSSTNVSVTLRAPLSAAAGLYTNYAEVTSFTGTNNNVQVDVDSSADFGAGNDPNEVNDDVSDSADHDDLDLEAVPVVLFDLALTKIGATPNPIIPGADVSFTITVFNQGTSPAQDADSIVVTEYPPAGWSLNDTAWSSSNTFTIASLSAGASTNLTVTLTAANPLPSGMYTNYAEVTAFTDTDGNLQVDSDSNADLGAGNDPGEIDDATTDAADHDDLDPDVVEVVNFDLALTKTNPSPNPVAPGGDISFTITVFNQGTTPAQDARNIVVQEFPPTSFNVNDANWSGSNQFTIPYLAAGASTNLSVQLTAPNPLPPSLYTNYSEIVSFTDTNGNAAADIDSAADLGPGNDPNEVNDDVSDSADHDDLDLEIFGSVLFDLALTKTSATPDPIVPGADVTFTITVFNQGVSSVQDAEQIVVAETPPAGWTLNDPAWSSSNTFTIAALAAGSSTNISVTMTAPLLLPTGVYTNYAEVISFTDTDGNAQVDVDSDQDLGAGNDPNEVNDATTDPDDHDDLDPESVTVLEFDLALTKTSALPNPISAGSDVTFTITVENQGTDSMQDAENIVVTEYPPAGWNLNDSAWSASNTFTIAALAAGASTSLTVTLTAPNPLPPGVYTNYAEVTSFTDTRGNPQTDVDSNTDVGPGNDPNEVDDATSDPNDEDDLDPDTVEVAGFDLALSKTSPTPDPIVPGGTVTFTITVENQGTLPAQDATNIRVDEFPPTVPARWTLSDPAWTATGTGGFFIIPYLAAGSQTNIPVTLVAPLNTSAGIFTNYAEVTRFFDTNGNAQVDIDSNDDLGPGGDTNEVNDATTDPADHDDLDPEPVTVVEFDLALTKTSASPNPIAPGNDVAFTITVINQGTSPQQNAENIVVTEYPPTSSGGWAINDPNWSGNTFIIPSLAAGASTNLTVTLSVPNPIPAGAYTNYAEITSFTDTNDNPQVDSDSNTDVGPGNDPNEVNDATTDADDEDDLDPDVVNVVGFDLALTKTSPTPNPIVPGGEVTFTITVENQGTVSAQDATNILIEDYPPSSPAGWTITDPDWSGGTFTIPFLAAGTSANVPITMTAPLNMGPGSYTNYAEVVFFFDANGNPQVDADSGNNVGPGNDPDEVNDATTDPDDEDDLDPEAVNVVEFDLALTKTAATPNPTAPGADVTFTITVFNQGTTPQQNAENIVITDYPPAGWTINDPAWSSSNTFTLGALAAGASTTIPVTLTAPNPLPAGTYTNYAEITSLSDTLGNPQVDRDSNTDVGPGNDPGEVDNATTDPNDEDDLDPDTVEVVNFDLALTKTAAAPNPTVQGSDVTFTITVINQGTRPEQDVRDVVITEYPPIAPVAWTINDPDWSGNTFTIPFLAAGASATVDVTLRVPNPLPDGIYSNYAEVTSFNDSSGTPQEDADSNADLGYAGDANEIDNATTDSADHDDLDPAPVEIGSPDISLSKTAYSGDNGTAGCPSEDLLVGIEGDVITYCFVVTNTGDLALSNIQLTDPSFPAPIVFPFPTRVEAESSDLGSGTIEWSGMTYNGDRDRLMVVDNGNNALYEYDLDANRNIISPPRRTLNFNVGAGDTEGIAWISGDTYAVLSENDAAVYIVTIPDPITAIGNGQVDSFFNTGILELQRAGNEGIAHDPQESAVTGTNIFWVVDERPPSLYKFDENGNQLAFFNLPGMTDSSSVFPHPVDDTVFVLSDETEVVIQYDLSSGSAVPIATQSLSGFEQPEGLTFSPDMQDMYVVSETGDGGLSYGHWQNPSMMTFDIPSLQPGEVFVTSIVSRITGDLTNTADVVGDPSTPDDTPIPDAPPVTDVDTAVVVQVEFDLALVKGNASPNPIQPGADVTFIVTVVNQGIFAPQAVTDVTLREFPPAGWTFNDPDWPGNIYTIPFLAAGASTNIPVTMTAPNPLPAGLYTNYAEITSLSDSNGVPRADLDSNADLGPGNDPNEVNDATTDPSDHDDLDPSVVEVVDFDLALTKTAATPNPIQAGADVTFTITVINQGTVPEQDAANIVVTDYPPTVPTAWTLNDPNWTPTGTFTIPYLAAGSSTNITVTMTAPNPLPPGDYLNYAEVTTLTDTNGNAQIDADSSSDLGPGNDPGEIDNATTNPSDHDDLDPASVTVVPFDLALIKTGATPSPSVPGGDVTFTITVFNQGTVPEQNATDIVVNEFPPPGWTINDPAWTGNAFTIPFLAAGATTNLSITLTAPNPLPPGVYNNYAEVTSLSDTNGTAQVDIDSNDDLGPEGDTNQVDNAINDPADHDDLDLAPIQILPFDLALTKSGASPNPIQPGADVTFIITVENQGVIPEQDATDIVVTEYPPSGWTLIDPNWTTNNTFTIPFLAAGASTNISVTLSAPNSLPAGPYTNYAEIVSLADTSGAPQIDGDSNEDIGPGADPNEIDNATSNPFDHDDLDPDVVDVVDFDLALTKTAATPNPILAGDSVTFTITVFNQGTLPEQDVLNVTVVDYLLPSLPGWTLADPNWPGGVYTIPYLAAGTSTNLLITLTSPTSLASGSYTNYAEVTGFTDTAGRIQIDTDSESELGPGGDPNEVNDATTDPADHDDLDPEAVQIVEPGIQLLKTVYLGQDGGVSCPGVDALTNANAAAITYCFEIINTGNTFLADVTLIDIDVTPALATSVGLLAPGESTFVHLDAVIDGDLTNTASVIGDPSDEAGTRLNLPSVSDEDPAVVDEVAPDLMIEKTVYLGHDGGTSCTGSEFESGESGDPVTYCFVVTNTGDTWLTDVIVSDTDLSPGFVENLGTIPPGGVITTHVDATIQADLTNTAQTAGNPATPSGTVIPSLDRPFDEDPAEVDLVGPGIQLVKTVSLGHDNGASCPGSDEVVNISQAPVTYCFEIRNSGDTFLNNVTLTDTDVTPNLSTNVGLIAPGQLIIVHLDSVIRGDFTNTADVIGIPTDLAGNPLAGVDPVLDNDPAMVDEVLPGIQLLKTVYAGHDGGVSCAGSELVVGLNGDAVTYCFVVINTGDTFLNDVTITDSDVDPAFMQNIGLLAPGQMATVHTETVISSDLINIADVSGRPSDSLGDIYPGLDPVTDNDPAEVQEINPGIQLLKTVYGGHDGGSSCPGMDRQIGLNGDNITYCFVVINTGDTALANITIADTVLDPDFTQLIGLLAPGQMATAHVETVISGNLTNIADVTGDPATPAGAPYPGLDPVTDDDPADVLEVTPGIQILKTVTTSSSCPGTDFAIGVNGDPVTYCFEVTNSGDTFLANVTISDTDLTPGFTTNIGVLAPGQVLLVPHQTVFNGDLTNRAAVIGSPSDEAGGPLGEPNVPPVTDDDLAVAEEVAPAIDLMKSVYRGHDSGASCLTATELQIGVNGDDVTYCFQITNTGDTPLSDTTVTDFDVTPAFTTNVGFLAPGQSITVFHETVIDGDLTNVADVVANPADEAGASLGLLPVDDDDPAQVDEVTPAIQLAKTVALGHGGAASCPGSELESGINGDAITYCFEIQNVGDTWLTNVTLTDTNLVPSLSTNVGLLAPGQVVTLRHESTIDGDLVNIADVIGDPSDGSGNPFPGLDKVTDDDNAEVNEVGPEIQILKTVYGGHDDGTACPGTDLYQGLNLAAVTYCFEITNTGDTFLNNVMLSDTDITAGLTTNLGLFAPGQSIIIHLETELDGDLTNVANVVGQPSEASGALIPGVDPVDDTDPAVIDEVAPSIQLLKTVALGTDAVCPAQESVSGQSGDPVTYCFEVTNTGDIPLNDVTITDNDLSPAVRFNIGLLAPGQRIGQSVNSTIQGDLLNTAMVTGTPSDEAGDPIPGLEPPTDEDTAEVDLVGPGIQLMKTVYQGHDSGASCPGTDLEPGLNLEAVTYCFEIINTGDTFLNNVTLTDSDVDPGISTNIGLMAPGQIVVLHLDSVIDGDLTNTAAVAGTPANAAGAPLPNQPQVTDDDPAEVDEVAPSIQLAKTIYSGHDNGASCPGGEFEVGVNGDPITYCFVLANTGDTFLSDVMLTDMDIAPVLSTNLGVLAPGQVITVHVASAISGDLLNTADLIGTPADETGTPIPGLEPPTDNDQAEIEQVGPDIQLIKTVSPGPSTGANCPGDDLVVAAPNSPVTYCFRITNTGDTFLNNVTLVDNDLMPPVSLNIGLLAPGESQLIPIETTVNGDLVNTANIIGTPADESGIPIAGLAPPTDEDEAEVREVGPMIQLVKTVYLGQDGGASCPGLEQVRNVNNAPVTYCFQVSNIGDVHLNNVVLTDNDISPVVAQTMGLMAPGEAVTLSNETVINGDLVNTAGVTGDPANPDGSLIPGQAPVTDSDTASVDEIAPGLSIMKTVYAGHNNGAACPGAEQVTGANADAVTYCFEIMNTGGTFLRDVTVIDDDVSPAFANVIPLLAPGEGTNLYVDSTITADLTNTVSIVGTPATPDGNPIPNVPEPTDSDTAEVEQVGPGIMIVKSVAANINGADGANCPGEKTVFGLSQTPVVYCFTVMNTGDTTLNNVTITDTDLDPPVSVNLGLLPPGATTSHFELAVIDGDLTNSAATVGTPATPDGTPLAGLQPPTDDDVAVVDDVMPLVDIEKTVYFGHNDGATCPSGPGGPSDENVTGANGDPVTYCFRVTNTGDILLNDVTITDTDLNPPVSINIGRLAPGAVVTEFVESAITADLTNTASVTGIPATPEGTAIPNLPPPVDEGTASVRQVGPGIQLIKTVAAGHNLGANCPGEERVMGLNQGPVTYCFTVVNTGDTSLNNVMIFDDDFDPALSMNLGLLAPGASAFHFEEREISGDLTNIAMAVGTPANPDGTTIPGLVPPIDTDDAVVDEIRPGVAIVKSVVAGHAGGASCPGTQLVTGTNGDPVTYCFRVTNTGDVHLDNVTLTDNDLNPPVSINFGLLAPGEAVTDVVEATITADLTNTAQVVGTPALSDGTPIPNVPDPIDEDNAVVRQAGPGIMILKTVYSGHDSGANCPGTELVFGLNQGPVTYCFTVVNTGDTTLNNVTVIDNDLDPPVNINLGLLAPGASAAHFEERLISGDLLNTASTTGTPSSPDGTPIPNLQPPTDQDDAAVNEVLPAIEISKTVSTTSTCPGQERVSGANGDPVTYCFRVTNTGDIHLNNVTLTDRDLNPPVTLNLGLLAPGETISETIGSTITADLTNSAQVVGTPAAPDGAPANLPEPTDEDSAEVEQVGPGIQLIKTVYSGHNSGASCPGSEEVFGLNQGPVTYCFTVVNTGDTSLNNVMINDNVLSPPISVNLGLLAPGATASHFEERTIDGDLLNTASTTGTPSDTLGNALPGLQPPTDEDDAAVDEIRPAIEIVKTVASGDTATAACPGQELVTGANGDPITYCFRVTNNGDVHLNNVTITDNDLDPPLRLNLGLLAPGEVVTESRSSTITGDLTNTAQVVGTPSMPDGTALPNVTPPMGEDSAEVRQVGPGIMVLKTVYTGHDSGASCPGEEQVVGPNQGPVTYCFTVVNTGDTALNNVMVFDSNLDPAVSVNLGLLAPGASVSHFEESAINGDLLNTATATGTPADASGNPIADLSPPTDTDDASVEEAAPGIEIIKTVRAGHDGGANCPGVEQLTGAHGDPVTYCFHITNTGDLHLDNVIITDNDITPAFSTNLGFLAPAESISTFTESSIAGSLINSASVSGTPATSNEIPITGLAPATDSDEAEVRVSAPIGGPNIEILKTVYNGHDNGANCPGQELATGPRQGPVTYCFTVINTGDTHLNNVMVMDNGLSPMVRFNLGLLAPGESTFRFAQSTITGDFTNTASTVGTPANPDGSTIPDLKSPVDSDEARVVEQAPQPGVSALSIDKTIYEDHDGGTSCSGTKRLVTIAGSPVTYCFTVTNTGGTPLQDVTLIDEALTPGLYLNLGFLAPGQSTNLFAETRAAILLNTAVAQGTPATPDGAPIPGATPTRASDSASVALIDPGLDLEKRLVSAEPNAGTGGRSFTLTFEFNLSNTGDQPLYNLRLRDHVTRLFGDLNPSAYTTMNGSFIANPDWDGSGSRNILAPNQALPVGGVGNVFASFVIAPTNAPGSFSQENIATIQAATSQGLSVDDASLVTVEISPPSVPNPIDPTDPTNTVSLTSLGNLIWFDQDNDGNFDAGEPPAPSVTVQLLDTNNVLVKTTQTDDNGYYLFDQLEPGQYSVFLPPENFAPGGSLAGAFSSEPTEDNPDTDTDLNDNGMNSSDPASEGIRSGRITLDPTREPTDDDETGSGTGGSPDNASNLTVDFGFFLPGSIGSTVWMDVDQDGFLNENLALQGIVGATVNLFQLDNGSTNLLDTLLTTSNGFYLFENLSPGEYIVEVDQTTIPQMYNIATTPVSVVVNLTSGEESLQNNFGFVATPTAIGLASFTATQTANGVTLNWATAWEENTLGFYIYRLDENRELIQVGDLVLGGIGTYSLFDKKAVGGRYLLAELTSDLSIDIQEIIAIPAVAATPRANKRVGQDQIGFIQAKANRAILRTSNDFINYFVSGVPDTSQVLDVSVPGRPLLLQAEFLPGEETGAFYFSYPPGADLEVAPRETYPPEHAE